MIATHDGHARIDYDKLKATVQTRSGFLDDVIDMNNYPLPRSAHDRRNRKIGLGVMGFADMLIALGIPYDSDEALAMAQELMSFIQRSRGPPPATSPRAGPFPNYDVSVFPERGGAPRRNATTTTIAPTDDQHSSRASPADRADLRPLLHPQRHDNDHLVEVHPSSPPRCGAGGSTPSRDDRALEGGHAPAHGIDPEDVARSYVTAHDISRRPTSGCRRPSRSTPKTRLSKTVNFPSTPRGGHPESVRPRLPPRLQGRHRLPGTRAATSRS